jgi:hypothetical protein
MASQVEILENFPFMLHHVEAFRAFFQQPAGAIDAVEYLNDFINRPKLFRDIAALERVRAHL